LLKGDRSRTVFSLAPVVCLFLITEWLLMQGRVSFAGPLNLVGVAAVSVFAGMFPTLLLVAGRRKGEYVPELVFRFLGWRPIVVGIYLVFLANLFIHGFIIWKQPEEQASAIGMGVLVIVTTLDVFRRRAFAPRSVLELRQAPDGALAFHLVADGRSLPAQAEYEDLTGRRSRADAGDRLPSLEALRQVTFSVPAGHSRYLKIWTHRVTDLGESEPLAVNTTVDGAGETTDMKLSGGSLIVPTRGDTWRVTLVPQQSPALVLS
jgi:hypothetical protein